MNRLLPILIFLVSLTPVLSADYYAGAAGSGTTCSAGTPCTPQEAISQAGCGDTVFLQDGTYQGAAYMLDVDSKSCTSGNELTIKAVNAGAAIIDGQGSDEPVPVTNSAYVIFQDFDAHSSNDNIVDVAGSSNNVTFERVVGYDASATGNAAVFGFSGNFSTCIDCVAFGTGRKMYGIIGADDLVYRRSFGRFEYTERTDPKIVFEMTYASGGEGGNRGIWENNISMWDTQSGSNTDQMYGHFTTGGPAEGIDNGSLYGNLAFQRAEDTDSGTTRNFWNQNNDGWHWEDNVSYLSTATFTSAYSWQLTPPVGSAYTHTNNMTVRDGHNQAFGSRVTVTNHTDIVHSGDLTQFYDHICKRYVNGALTSDPLFPWPMNQRIIDAMTRAGYTGDDLIDVNQMIIDTFGAMPVACDADQQAGDPSPSGSTCTAGNDAAGYSKAVPVTIAAGQVSGGPHTNFPVYKCVTDNSLRTTGNGGSVTDAQGDDIIWADASGNSYAFHRESYDGTAGTFCAFFREPSLAGGEDACLFHGNSSVTTYQGVEADAFSAFVHRYGLEEDPSGTAPQMTDAQGSDGTTIGSMTSGDSVSGQVGNALDLEGTDDAVDLNFSGANANNTLEFWIQMDAKGESNFPSLFDSNDGSGNGSTMWVPNAEKLSFMVRHATGNEYWTMDAGNFDTSAAAWTYVAVEWSSDPTAPVLYLNGSSEAWSLASDTSSGGPDYGTQDWIMGDDYNSGVAVDARFDEVRWSSSKVGSDWIATTYNNLNAPDTFSTAGTVETVSSVTADAGPDQSVDEREVVTLDCSGSTYATTKAGVTWTQTAGTSVTLSDDNIDQPTFTVPVGTQGTTLTFQCEAEDDNATSDTDTVDINVNALSVTVRDTSDNQITLNSYLWRCPSEVSAANYVSIKEMADGNWIVQAAPGVTANPGSCTILMQGNNWSWETFNTQWVKYSNEIGTFPPHFWLGEQ